MDDERPRTVRMPQWIWDALDREAQDCKRSSVKQLETVLTVYYRGKVSEVDKDHLEAMSGRTETPSPNHIPHGGTLKLGKRKSKTG
jgi:hypothetical protein